MQRPTKATDRNGGNDIFTTNSLVGSTGYLGRQGLGRQGILIMHHKPGYDNWIVDMLN